MLKKSHALYLGLGTEFVGLVAACLWLGHWIDERWAWSGLGMMAGLVTALAIWSAHFIWVARTLARGPLDKSGD